MTTYIFVFLGSLLLALAATPITIGLARRLGILDVPDARKVHAIPVPRIGGVAIYVSMMGLLAPVFFLRNLVGEEFRQIGSKILVVLGAASVMFVVGLIDDIRNVRARVKLAVELTVALLVCWAGIRIESVSLWGGLSVDFGLLSWPLTVIWIVGITNAINLSDGLDGLAAGICAVACGVIALLAGVNGDVVMAILTLALLGSLTGFLFFNFEPAKIFMGDSGSLFLGTTIATSSVVCAAKTHTIVGLALPILALGIPLLDTLFTVLRRFLDRRSLFSPDRSHFHHRLLALGIRQRHAVVTAYVATIIAAGLGMFMLVTRNAETIAVFVSVLFLLVLLFRAVGSVRLHETLEGLRHNYALSSQKKHEREDFEQVELHFRQARHFDDWWKAVCLAADTMDFAAGQLPLVQRDGAERVMVWENTGEADVEHEDLIALTLPVKDRRSDCSLKLDVQVRSHGSLESAGHRVTLFGRLLEEYSPATLAE